jgi:hypothetical protein
LNPPQAKAGVLIFTDVISAPVDALMQRVIDDCLGIP